MSLTDIPNGFSQNDPVLSTTPGMRVTWIGMGVNVLLSVFKIWVGLLSKSQALLADGIHSVSDLFSDVVVLLGLKWGRQVEDDDHPYGHARIETIASMIVGMVLLIVGGGMAYGSISAIYNHSASTPSLMAIYAAATSIVLKEVLYWYTISVGRRLKSYALIGNAWHHRSDALSSIAVLIGVGATYVNPNWYLADSYAALVVTVFIMRVGVKLVWMAFKELADTAPDSEMIARLNDCAETVAGVRQAHDVRARYSGPQIFVELDIVVDPGLTVREGHNIARDVKIRLQEEFSDVSRVKIHIDPEPKPDETSHP
ncbi:MAG: cation diffusion facilitator family transporter [candidate division Zixibacteria bacterium]|nr:cation diffusion facilitator family transporter [candidate division Zixibacteria bacterium]